MVAVLAMNSVMFSFAQTRDAKSSDSTSIFEKMLTASKDSTTSPITDGESLSVERIAPSYSKINTLFIEVAMLMIAELKNDTKTSLLERSQVLLNIAEAIHRTQVPINITTSSNERIIVIGGPEGFWVIDTVTGSAVYYPYIA